MPQRCEYALEYINIAQYKNTHFMLGPSPFFEFSDSGDVFGTDRPVSLTEHCVYARLLCRSVG
jgi:hypothetical protein